MSPAPNLGPVGRLGAWTATHFRTVLISWIVLVGALGFFAPKVEHALSGAGWEVSGSESVAAREMLDDEFDGLSSSALQVVVHSPDQTLADEPFGATVRDVEHRLSADGRVARVVGPAESKAVSEDGHTVVVQAAAGSDPNEMVRAADDLKEPLAELGSETHGGQPDRRLRHVVGLQRGEQDGDAQVGGDLVAGDADDPRARLRRRWSPPACR